MTRDRGVALVVGFLTREEQQFLELSLGQYYDYFGKKPYENNCCAFCGEIVQFEKDLSVGVISSKLSCHIKVRHKVIAMADILSKLSVLPEDRRSQLIETLILKNG